VRREGVGVVAPAFCGVLRLSCWLLLALLLVPLRVLAQPSTSVGDLVAKLAPGSAEAPAKALSEGAFATEQLGSELDLLAPAGQLGKIGETLQAVQKAAGAKYWTEDFDLVAGLVALPQADPDAYRALLGTACILRSLAKDGRKDAVARMILVAPDHGGMLRFEVTRRVKALGEKAIAPLILARSDRRVRGFAWSTLDAMNKTIPGDAVQTRSNEVLSAVLDAYGATKDMDALGVVMSFIGAERDAIRGAAREALLGYSDLALPKLREVLGNIQGPPPSDWNAARVAGTLFDLLDKQRLADVDALVDDGLSKSEQGDFVVAVQDFDKVLARMPFHARRNLMAPAYAKLALSLEETDRLGARVAFQESLDLDPNGTHAFEARADLAVMDGQDLVARGIEDREPFERALLLDPGNAKARAALERMDVKARDAEGRSRKWMWAAIAGGGFFALFVLFARLPRRRKGSPRDHARPTAPP
jgi:tetratricopeptide (TPR) repeat protein